MNKSWHYTVYPHHTEADLFVIMWPIFAFGIPMAKMLDVFCHWIAS